MLPKLCFFCQTQTVQNPNELLASNESSPTTPTRTSLRGFQLLCKLLNVNINNGNSLNDLNLDLGLVSSALFFCGPCESRLGHLYTLIGIYNQVRRDIQDCISTFKTNFHPQIDNICDNQDYDGESCSPESDHQHRQQQHSIQLLREDAHSKLAASSIPNPILWDNLAKEKLNEHGLSLYHEINYIQFHQEQDETLNTSSDLELDTAEEIEIKPMIIPIQPWTSDTSASASTSTSSSRPRPHKSKQNLLVKVEPLGQGGEGDSCTERFPIHEDDAPKRRYRKSENVRLKQRLKRKHRVSQEISQAQPSKDPIISSRLRPRLNKASVLDSSDDDRDSDWAIPPSPTQDYINTKEDDDSESDEYDEQDAEADTSEAIPKKRGGRKKSSLSSVKYRRKDGKYYYEGIEFLESLDEWTCTICDEKFQRVKNHKKLFKHIDKHKGILRYKCDECGKGYSSSGGLLKHRKTSHTLREEEGNELIKIHKCSICGKPSKDPEKAIAHERWNHMNRDEYDAALASGKKPPKKVANLMHWMIGLQKAKEGPKCYICAICGLGYAKAYNLKQHEESVHGSAETFNCCGRVFKGKRKYQIHVYRAHKTSINNKCQHCGKCVHNKSTLIRHLKQVHNEYGGKDFACHLCPFRAASNSRLQMHLDCHGTEKRFKCEFCDMAFKLKWTLTRHRLVIHKEQVSKE